MKKGLFPVIILAVLACLFAAFMPTLGLDYTWDEILGGIDPTQVDYALYSENFEKIIGKGETVDISALAIERTANNETELIPVTEDMIVYMDTSDSVGYKKVIVKYLEEEYTLHFEVRYRVDIAIDGEIVDSQLVKSPEDITLPSANDEITENWNILMPDDINDNFTINSPLSSMIPPLYKTGATYGDALAELTLPSNEHGAWVLKNSEGTVGDAGYHEFEAVFIWKDTSRESKDGIIALEVKKLKIEFTDTVTSFIYDGSAHFPTYKVPEGISVTEIGNDGAVDSGSYEFMLIIDDPNREGELSGSFTIEKAPVTVTVKDASLVYGNTASFIPEYTVSGFDSADLLGISVSLPTEFNAGTYTMSALSSNENIILTVNPGTLTVDKATFDPGTPALDKSTAEFEDKLSSISFLHHPGGVWTWLTPDSEVGSVGEKTFGAKFTPNNKNYYDYETEITVTVVKRNLTITVENTTFVYNTSARTLNYTLTDKNGKVYEGLFVAGNDPKTNAGVYDMNLTVSDSSYTGSTSVKMTITKAMPNADFSFITEGVWRDGIKLSDITLPAGYTWSDPTSLITGAGTASFGATFTPADTANYETENGTLTVSLDKATASIEGLLPSYTFTYNKGAHSITGIVPSHTESEITVSYRKNGETADSIIGAGSYTVTVTLPETANYKKAEITASVTVLPAPNNDSVNTAQSAVYKDSLSVIALPENENGIWSIKEGGAIDSVGTVTVTAVFTPYTENYLAREVDITLTVAKKPVSVPIVSNKTYTGTTLYSGLTSTELYSIISDEGGADEGEYSVTVRLTDPDHYTWATASGDSVTVKYLIAKAVNNWITPPTIDGWIWGESANTGSAEVEFGGILIEYRENKDGAEFSTAVPTAAGSYIARFTSTDTIHTKLTVEIPFTVAKKKIPVPTVGNAVFTSLLIKSGLTDTEHYTVSDEGGISVGTYTAALTLTDTANTEWADGSSGAVKEISYSIEKGQVTFDSFTVNGWIWGESGSASASASFGASVTILYSATADGTYTETVPTEPGTYFVKAVVSEHANYYGAEVGPRSLVIAKATPTVTAPTYPDGTLYLNLVDLSKDYISAPTASVAGTFSYSAITFKDGGSTYDLIFTPTDSAHYGTVTVKAAIVLKTVAVVYTSSALTEAKSYHGTIEDAIRSAVSGDAILVTHDASGNLYITENITISSGVTLILSYGEYSTSLAEVYNQKNSSGHYEATMYGKTLETTAETCTTLVTVKSGVTITSNGNIIIAGILTGGNAGYDCGVTAGAHARLSLETDAALVLNSGSNTDCLGYIVDAQGGEGGSVTLKDGATMLQPFAIFDFRGGSYTYAVYSKRDNYGICPFSEYAVKNVESLLTIESDGLLKTAINMYAGDQQNATTVNLVGNVSSASLIQLNTADSYLTSKYSAEKNQMDLDIYGGAQSGSMSMALSLGSLPIIGDINITVKTTEYYFPIPHLYDISLNTLPGKDSASYTMNQKFLFRGGSVFTVSEGVTLTANEIAVVDEADITDITYGSDPYEDTGAGLFTVNGTLIVNKLAGDIRTEVDGATVTVKSSVSITLYFAYGSAISGSSLSASLDKVQEIDQPARLVYGNTVYAKVETKVSEGGKWPVVTTAISIGGDGFDFTVTGNIYDADGNLIATGYDSRTDERRSEFFVDEGAIVNFIGLPASRGVFINGSFVNTAGAGNIYKGGDVEWIVSNGDTCEIKTMAVLSGITNSSGSAPTVTYNSDGTITISVQKKYSSRVKYTLTIASTADPSNTQTKSGTATFIVGSTVSVSITLPANGVADTVTITG